LEALVREGPFLNAEIGTDQIQSHIGAMPDGRNVTRTVPGGLHLKCLSQSGNFAGRGKAAGLRNVHADVVDQAVTDDDLPFMRAVEQFTHSEWCGALGANLTEVFYVLR